jgi:hypothetical protein
MKKLLMILFSTFIIYANCHAGTIDPQVSDEKYVVYGSKFQNVAKICCLENGPEGVLTSCGSAVIIDSHWAVTAAHVVFSSKQCSIKIKDKSYEITKTIVHPEFKNNVFGYHDIALCYIKEPIKLDFYPELYEDKDEVGKVCSIAGWGFTGTFITGSTRHDNKRRAGSNVIDKTERTNLVCSPSPKGVRHTELEFLIASGDSGGGLFIDNKLAGIHSSVLASDKVPDSTYTDESCHTRISLYVKWIKEHVKRKN